MKKLISHSGFILLASLLVILLLMPPTQAQAAEITAKGTCGAEGDNLTWTLTDDGILTISGTGEMANYYYASHAPWRSYGSNITSVIIQEGITNIGNSAFAYCDSLADITIPTSISQIGEDAFYKCSDLADIVIPSSVTSIGASAFSDCDSLITVVIPSGVTKINHSTFSNCDNLATIVIPSNITNISYYAFISCKNLTSLTIEEGVTSIGHSAFLGCEALTSVSIPTTVTSIGTSAFADCGSLEGIWVDKDNAYYSNDGFGVLFNKEKNELIQAPGALSGTYTVPEGVERILESAFYGCEYLKNFNLPDSMTSIGEWAFEGCISLTEIVIPASVTIVGDYAFVYCKNLSKVKFLGDAPSFGYYGDSTFGDFFTEFVVADIYYPAGNTTWTKNVMQSCGGQLTWIPYYEILQGADSVLKAGQALSLTIRASGAFEKFESVSVDGTTVPTSSYTVSEGSAIVTFQADYLKTLNGGEHTVIIHFSDGTATTTLTILATIGDIDGDGTITSDDVVQLLLHVSMPDLFPVTVAVDFDGSGTVDSGDVVQLLLHVSMPDLFPLQ